MSNTILTEEEFEIVARFATIKKDETISLEYPDLETIQKLQEKGYLTRGFLENPQEKEPHITELGKETYQFNLETRFVKPRSFKGLSRIIRNYFTNL